MSIKIKGYPQIEETFLCVVSSDFIIWAMLVNKKITPINLEDNNDFNTVLNYEKH